jgi:futalosine hydrolase
MSKTAENTVVAISAVPFESAALLQEFHSSGPVRLGCLDVHSVNVNGMAVIHADCGIGKVNAAMAAALLIQMTDPALVICFGLGGAYPGTFLSPGDLALADEEVFPDEGVMTGQGFRPIESLGFELAPPGGGRKPNSFPLSGRFQGRAEAALRETGIHYLAGRFLTVSTVTGTDKQALYLRRRYSALCENMEGGAVAQACMAAGVPMVEIRGISNRVERRDRRNWKTELAAGNVRKAVSVFLRLLSAPK